MRAGAIKRNASNISSTHLLPRCSSPAQSREYVGCVCLILMLMFLCMLKTGTHDTKHVSRRNEGNKEIECENE